MGKVDNGRLSKDVKAKQNGASSDYSHNKFTYLDVSLSSDDKARLSAYIETGELTPDEMFKLAADGYRCTVSPDGKGSGYTASIVDCVATSPTFNHCLTGRSSDPARAWASVCYKHLYMLTDGWQAIPRNTLVDFE